MPSYKVTLSIEDRNEPAVRKRLLAFSSTTAQTAQVEKLGGSKTRRERLDDAVAQMEDAKSEVESLQEEMQSWHDNMPENLQDGEKGTAVQEAAEALENIAGELDSAISDAGAVEFPGMM